MKKLDYTIKTSAGAYVKVKQSIMNALGFEARISCSDDESVVVTVNETAIDTFRTLINNLMTTGLVVETDPKL